MNEIGHGINHHHHGLGAMTLRPAHLNAAQQATVDRERAHPYHHPPGQQDPPRLGKEDRRPHPPRRPQRWPTPWRGAKLVIREGIIGAKAVAKEAEKIERGAELPLELLGLGAVAVAAAMILK